MVQEISQVFAFLKKPTGAPFWSKFIVNLYTIWSFIGFIISTAGYGFLVNAIVCASPGDKNEKFYIQKCLIVGEFMGGSTIEIFQYQVNNTLHSI